MSNLIPFVRACQIYFSTPPFDRKIEIPEFKELTRQDKVELREMLIDEGFNIEELPIPTATT
jgi:hypothetical protein